MLRLSAPAAKRGPRSLRAVALTTAAAVPILFAAAAGLGVVSIPHGRHVDPEVTGSLAPAPLRIDSALLQPAPMMGKDAKAGWSSVPVTPGTLRVPGAVVVPAAIQSQPQAQPGLRSVPPVAAPTADTLRSSRAPQAIPLPVPRPAEFAAKPADATVARAAARPAPRRTRTVAAPAIQPDNRSWFEKLFDLNAPGGPGVSYAALDSRPTEVAPRPRLAPSPIPAPTADAGTAVYDITARTLILPNGERLEAHSGLGDKMDDPRFVHVRMRGATPPGTYVLTEREALFHGVRAIRLNPVGGSSAIHGRAGLLAHTYLLGPNGDSNGCVSLRDYDRFLQAYLRGEIRRLVVVAGNGQDHLPVVAARDTTKRQGWARSARGA